ncbi:hypothetical protein NDU88_008982 [Pleurodeles waltl]|uniref:Uncharacterized protein n=1 Tax=Pleurodeles waltl TaxID=8319 RepID=A0AAV7RZQ1_PLEWA|nr:hypothetical protein NDU88_008982 [Pleurodeles waltl]
MGSGAGLAGRRCYARAWRAPTVAGAGPGEGDQSSSVRGWQSPSAPAAEQHRPQGGQNSRFTLVGHCVVYPCSSKTFKVCQIL